MTVTAEPSTPANPGPRKMAVPASVSTVEITVGRDAPGDAEHPSSFSSTSWPATTANNSAAALALLQALAVDGDERGAAIADQRVDQPPWPGSFHRTRFPGDA